MDMNLPDLRPRYAKSTAVADTSTARGAPPIAASGGGLDLPDLRGRYASGHGTSASDFKRRAAAMTHEERVAAYRATKPGDPWGDFLAEEIQKPQGDETPEQAYDRAAIGKPASGMRPSTNEIAPWQSAVLGGGDSALIGGLDEAYAAVNSTLSDKTYEQALSEARQIQQMAEQQNPRSYVAGQVGGALATAPLTLEATGMRLLPRVAIGLAEGAGFGAAYGFNSGRDAEERASGAISGGLLGGAIGGAAPAVMRGLSGAGSRVARAVDDVRTAASPARARDIAERQVGRALSEDFAAEARRVDDAVARGETPEMIDEARRGLTAGEIRDAQAMGQNAVLGDQGGASLHGLARNAANASDAARGTLEGVTASRAKTRDSRILEVLRAMNPTTGRTADTLDDLRKAAASENEARYQQAYAHPAAQSVFNNTIETLTTAPAVQDAIRAALRRSGNSAAMRGARAVRNPFEAAADGSLKPVAGVTPTLQFWDAVKRSLDDEVSSLYRSGRNDAGREVQGLRDALRNELDQLVPSYAQARAGAAAAFGAADALTAGTQFVGAKSTMRASQMQRQLAKFSASERDLFRIGLLDDLSQRVKSSGTGFLKSKDVREKLNVALGPQDAQALTAYLFRENIMSALPQAVSGGSTTARQQIGAEAFKYATGVGLSSVLTGGLGGDDLIGGFAAKHALIDLATSAAQKHVGRRAAEQVAQQVAELLTSPDPAAVVELVQRAQKSDAFYRTLQEMSDATTRAISRGTTATLSGPKVPYEPALEARYADGGAVLSKADIESMTHTRSYGTGKRPIYLETMGRKIPLGEGWFYTEADGTEHAPAEDAVQFLHDAARMGVYGVPMVGPAVGAALDVTEAVATNDPLAAGMAVALGPGGKLAKGVATGVLAAGMNPATANSDELNQIERLGAKTREMLTRRARANGSTMEDEYARWLALNGKGQGYARGGGVDRPDGEVDYQAIERASGLYRPTLERAEVDVPYPTIEELMARDAFQHRKRRGGVGLVTPGSGTVALRDGGRVSAPPENNAARDAYHGVEGSTGATSERTAYDHRGAVPVRQARIVGPSASRRNTTATDRTRQRVRPERMRAAMPPVDPRQFWDAMRSAMMERGVDLERVNLPVFEEQAPEPGAVVQETVEAAMPKAPLAPELQKAAAKKRAKRLAKGKPHEILP